MKNIIIVLSCLMIGTTLSSNAAGLVDFAGLQAPQSEFRLMEQQRFRQEEFNEYKDMKQQKEERNRKLNLQDKYNKQRAEQQQTTQDINIIRQNGQLILKPTTEQ